jgi:dihydroorotase
MQIDEWLKRWTSGPAEILGRQPPTLSVGQPADVIVFDPAADWVVKPEDFQSRSTNSPFSDMNLSGKMQHTFFHGKKTL